MPVVEVESKYEVLDDEDPGIITAGSIVTVGIKLKRRLRWSNEDEVKLPDKVESKPRKSHSVHCPYFPDDKQEFWWVYIVDRKRFALVTAPLLVTSLVSTQDIELKFTAPHKPGTFSYTIVVRSDSYVDCTVQRPTTVSISTTTQSSLTLSYPFNSLTKVFRSQTD